MRCDREEVRSRLVNPAQNERGPNLSLMPFGYVVSGGQWGRGTDLKSICLSIVMAVTTIGVLPVESACSAMLDAISAVVNSVSAAVPAPQHRMFSVMKWI